MMFAMLMMTIAPVQATTPVAPMPAAAPATDPNKMVCKRQPVVGSNIPGKKRCLTRGQWDTMALEAQRFKRGTEQSLTTRNQ